MEFDFKLTEEEAAIISAECALSLNDGRCSDEHGRAMLEQIMRKMSEPFGFDVKQLIAISKAILDIKSQRRMN